MPQPPPNARHPWPLWFAAACAVSCSSQKPAPLPAPAAPAPAAGPARSATAADAGRSQTAAPGEAPTGTAPAAAQATPPVDSAADTPAVATGESNEPRWPLWTLFTPPAGKEVPLPAGTHATSMDIDPTGVQVVLIAEDAAGKAALYAWDYEHPLRPLTSPTLAGRQVTAVAFSKFRHDLYVTSRADADYRIERFAFQHGALENQATLYHTKAPLVRLIVPFLRYNGAERLYFGRESEKGRYQILSVRADGTAHYEVTSPTGELTALSDPKLRALAAPPPGESSENPEGQKPPSVQKARSALPVSLHPISGSLLWEAGDRSLHERGYAESNWNHDSQPVPAAREGATLSYSPNGHYRLRTLAAQKGAELLDPAGRVAERVGAEVSFALPPLWAPSGRAVIAAIQTDGGARLEVVPLADKLAGVRYLPDVHLAPGHLEALSRSGLLFAETQADQIYQPYEALEYTECHEEVRVPIYATVDGMLEVLSAGFQAAFMLTEQRVSRPRLEKFLKLLWASARRQELPRIARIAEVAGKALDGDYKDPEGRRMLAESSAPSTLHTVQQAEAIDREARSAAVIDREARSAAVIDREARSAAVIDREARSAAVIDREARSAAVIDFADFHPRGPYAATSKLKNYFRAFKYINLLQLTPDESAKLRGDAELLAAFTAWVDTQRPFMSGSRRPGILDPDRRPPPHARPDCIPAAALSTPSLFPLSFGIDSEIMESTVARLGVAADCVVPGRALPEGLDLMTGLGSPTAQALQQPEYATFPELKAVHESLRRRFAQPLTTAQVPEAWLRLIQLLGSEDYVPEGVDQQTWRRRLLSTALASWTSFRHTTVLVNEEMSAECGGGFEGFEQLAREPVRGAVDPLPQSWGQLAAVLDLLGAQAGKVVADKRVGEVLLDAAKSARGFRSMAERQMKGVPLSGQEYDTIQRFSGEVEHPYLLLKATLSGREGADVVRPDPMAKIVSVASAQGQHLQVALGHPLQVMALLPDRGLQVPATGAIYTYYEIVDSKRLDDGEWRKRLDRAPRPARPKWEQFDLHKAWARQWAERESTDGREPRPE